MQTTESKSQSPFHSFIKKFLKQRVAVVSLLVLVVIIMAGILAPMLVPFNPHVAVTDQYKEKGIEVAQLTSTIVPVEMVYNDGSMKHVDDLSAFTVESDDRRVAAARGSSGGLLINANSEGHTSVLITYDEMSTRVSVGVSNDANAPIALSQLLIRPVDSLHVGDQYQIDFGALLTNGDALEGTQAVVAFAKENGQAAVETVANDGFGNTRVSKDIGGLQFESLNDDVVEVDDDGVVRAVGQGEALIKVSIDGISSLLPIAVEQPLTAAVPVRIVPASIEIELHDVYKHQAPSKMHWFGTDHQNRDILSRVLLGTRETLLIGFVSVAIGAVIGTVLGLIAGYYGRWLDRLITRFTDILLAFPGILLAIAVIALLGPGIANIIFAVAVFTIPIFIRIVRGNTLALKEMTYIEAAKAVGVKDSVILIRHIFPGTLSVVMVYLTMRIGTAILIGAALSFLGLGGDITAPEWGAMLSAAKDNSRNVLHPTLFPGLAIVITVLSFNLLGDGLRDALDPKLKD